MLSKESNIRILELDSTKRNRNIYPNPSSFEATLNLNTRDNIVDPVCNGAIYYSFSYYVTSINNIEGFFGEGTTQAEPILLISKLSNILAYVEKYNFFVGWYIFLYDQIGLIDQKIIRSYDPITGKVTLDRPFNFNFEIQPGISNGFYFKLTTQRYGDDWFLPSVDSNNIVLNKTPLYYNGYYLIWENARSSSNFEEDYNSPNIYAARIVYYDSETQFIYLDDGFDGKYLYSLGFRSFTIRKSLPLERIFLNKPTYNKKTKADNPIIGPLPGYVVPFPDNASSIDNYYKGKYIYVVSNNSLNYNPPLPPKENILPINDSFYPIYGLFLIVAYNGTTKEASIQTILNKGNLNNTKLPLFLELKDINSGSFVPYYNLIITNEGGGLYRAQYIEENIPPDLTNGIMRINNLEPNRQYRIVFRYKPYFIDYDNYYVSTVIIYNDYNQLYPEEYISNAFSDNNFKTFTVYIKTYYDYINFKFENDPGIVLYFEWDLLEVALADTINIVDAQYDNYAPLDYNGTIVSANQNVCHEITIESITLPNTKLLTGSSIAFYPFVYIKLENATTPIGVSPNTIISNNPPSTGAIFSVYVPQVDNPEFQKFITLTGGGTQIIKFNPNDNLRFSVYLPDGTLFTSLLPDVLSPYSPDPLLQIHAVFNLIRINSNNINM